MTESRLSQEPVETLSTVTPVARISQLPVEALSQSPVAGWFSQLAVEVLSSTRESVRRRQPQVFVVT